MYNTFVHGNTASPCTRGCSETRHARSLHIFLFTGLGKDEIPMVGLSTDLADYYLKNPSSAYSKIYSDLADKVKLTGVVYGILEEVMEKGTLNAFSYEDMLDELASKDQDINEETLLQYGAFIVQQVGHTFY